MAQNETPPEKTLKDHALYVLDDDLKRIALINPEEMLTCLSVQSCRQSNRLINALSRL